jgi:hypothetical protein
LNPTYGISYYSLPLRITKQIRRQVFSELARSRWDNLTPEQRSAQAKQSAATRLEGATARERSERMRALINRRWKKKRAAERASKRGQGSGRST